LPDLESVTVREEISRLAAQERLHASGVQILDNDVYAEFSRQ
jgi:hypothetical protein